MPRGRERGRHRPALVERPWSFFGASCGFRGQALLSSGLSRYFSHAGFPYVFSYLIGVCGRRPRDPSIQVSAHQQAGRIGTEGTTIPGREVRYRRRSSHRACQSSPIPLIPAMITSCPAWRVQVICNGDVDAQMTRDASFDPALVGAGLPPRTVPEPIIGAFVLGDCCFALNWR